MQKLSTNIILNQPSINFQNTIIESEKVRIIDFQYCHDEGIGSGAIKYDSPAYHIFSGNQVTRKVDLKNRHSQFEDITETSRSSTNSWTSGISIINMNGYTCYDRTSIENQISVNRIYNVSPSSKKPRSIFVEGRGQSIIYQWRSIHLCDWDQRKIEFTSIDKQVTHNSINPPKKLYQYNVPIIDNEFPVEVCYCRNVTFCRSLLLGSMDKKSQHTKTIECGLFIPFQSNSITQSADQLDKAIILTESHNKSALVFESKL